MALWCQKTAAMVRMNGLLVNYLSELFVVSLVISLAPVNLLTYTAAEPMFAVVTIAGFQEKVSEGQKLRVPTLDAEVGKTVSFKDVVLLAKTDSDVTVGTPHVAGASVDVKVLEHGNNDKIRVTKMKRRKGYRRVHGHKQGYTEVEVTKIKA